MSGSVGIKNQVCCDIDDSLEPILSFNASIALKIIWNSKSQALLEMIILCIFYHFCLDDKKKKRKGGVISLRVSIKNQV